MKSHSVSSNAVEEVSRRFGLNRPGVATGLLPDSTVVHGNVKTLGIRSEGRPHKGLYYGQQIGNST